MSKQKALLYMEKKAESDQHAAMLAFDLLLEKAVGIGDHSTSDFLSNLDEALNNLVDANDRIEAVEWLKNLYGDS
tara:strand:- start:80 stop:304 length:225 start_codon:yes stop_codon:yes gene_type:complete